MTTNAAGVASIDRRSGCARAPKTTDSQLNKGDKFTIDGWGTSARGHEVRNGRSTKTGRKMRVKTLQVFVVTDSGTMT